MNTRRKKLPAEERRAVTVEAVVALAAEQNPNAITTAAIAKRMGLTQGALFRHFPNKDAILQAVIEWVAERLLARVDKAVQGHLLCWLRLKPCSWPMWRLSSNIQAFHASCLVNCNGPRRRSPSA